MSISAPSALVLCVLSFGLGFWCAFHIPKTLQELEVFRQFTVRKVTGVSICPKNFTRQPTTN